MYLDELIARTVSFARCNTNSRGAKFGRMTSASKQRLRPSPAADLRVTSRAFGEHFALITRNEVCAPLWTIRISTEYPIRVAVSRKRKQMSPAHERRNSNSKAELIAGNELPCRA